MWSKNKYQKGFTLAELVAAMTIFTLVLTTAVKVFVPSTLITANTYEYNQIQLLLKKKCEEFQIYGFWLWDVDTDNPVRPSNAKDPAVEWKASLAAQNFTRKGTVEVTFLKPSGSDYVPFSGAEFDGNLARNRVQVTVSLESSKGGMISQTIELVANRTPQQITGTLHLIREALEIYYLENGSYPTTNSLATLVPNYLAEIPNNPFTDELEKITHTEEQFDWQYINDTGSSTITLAALSHVKAPLTWSY